MSSCRLNTNRLTSLPLRRSAVRYGQHPNNLPRRNRLLFRDCIPRSSASITGKTIRPKQTSAAAPRPPAPAASSCRSWIFTLRKGVPHHVPPKPAAAGTPYLRSARMASLHHKQFVCNNLRLSLVQKTPSLCRIHIHLLLEVTPEVFRLLRSRSGRRCRELTQHLDSLLQCDNQGFQVRALAFVHGVRTFRTKELQRVIAENIGVGQDFVVSQILLVLVNSRSRRNL